MIPQGQGGVLCFDFTLPVTMLSSWKILTKDLPDNTDYKNIIFNPYLIALE